jgi:putative DNA primase/helicase
LGNDPDAAEMLLSIVGGDVVAIDRKYKSPWTGVMPVRFLLASNELSLPKDASGAIVNRVLVLKTKESFLDREDRDLERQISTEIPAIVKWALEGYRDLVARQRFVQPESVRDDLDNLAHAVSPVFEFADDLAEFGPKLEVRHTDLYRLWCNWCESCGRKDPGIKRNFTNMIHARFPNVHSVRRKQDKVREWWFIGIAPLKN